MLAGLSSYIETVEAGYMQAIEQNRVRTGSETINAMIQ